MLYAHNDVKLWGAQFKMAAGRAGIPCELFQHADEVPEGARAFVRLDQQAEQRELSKRILETLHQRDRGIMTLPRRVEGIWYDDKVAQFNVLAKWLPDTHIIGDPGFARATLERGQLRFPFISKAAEGSASKAVRLIKNKDQAEIEIQRIFYGEGMPSVYDRRQKGYVYWQQFMQGNVCDYRIVVMGNYIMGLVRWNRNDRPFASGSGKHEAVTDFENEDARRAAALCLKISRVLNTKWMAYDVVFDPDTKEPKVLEMSSSWTPHSYSMCPLFVSYPDQWGLDEPHIRPASNYVDTFSRGGAMFDIAVQVLRGDQ
jgi:glutathione synthase/RimK-type ligase-like ATP-grasp enzyme